MGRIAEGRTPLGASMQDLFTKRSRCWRSTCVWLHPHEWAV